MLKSLFFILTVAFVFQVHAEDMFSVEWVLTPTNEVGRVDKELGDGRTLLKNGKIFLNTELVPETMVIDGLSVGRTVISNSGEKMTVKRAFADGRIESDLGIYRTSDLQCGRAPITAMLAPRQNVITKKGDIRQIIRLYSDTALLNSGRFYKFSDLNVEVPSYGPLRIGSIVTDPDHQERKVLRLFADGRVLLNSNRVYPARDLPVRRASRCQTALIRKPGAPNSLPAAANF